MQRLVSFVAVALAVLALASGSSGAAEPAAAGRTAVVGIDFEPNCLNALLDDCNVLWSHWIAGTALAGAFRVLPDFSFEPVLVDRVDVQTQPFALTYRIKQQAVWSDGTPVTSDDFIFTLDSIRDPGNATVLTRAGYAFVSQVERVDAKTVTFRFSQPYPNWRSLFPFVLPKHVLQGHDLDTVWRDEIADPVTHAPIGSGPFLVTAWTRGVSLTVTRNPRWWGERAPFLDSVQFRPLPNSNDQFNGIRDGSLDLIFPQPQLGLADLDRLDGVALQRAPGTTMEHLDFNVGSAEMPLLRESWFRQAVAFAIDRPAVAAASYEALFPNHPAHHNLSFSSEQPEYEPVFARYAYDTQAVARIMLEHGCVSGADGIWSCAGIRASVKFATTSFNLQRERVQQDLAAQARAAGIELVPDNDTGAVLFGTRLPARQYELIMFAWVFGGGLPRVRELYGCNGEQNYMGYCSQAVTDLAGRIETELDPVTRAQLINDANRILAEDAPSIPLYLRPALLVHRETLRGPQVNPSGHGTWNIDVWRGPDVIAPESTATASPAANANGWHSGPVTVELAAVDDDTGVHQIRYSLTGAQTGGGVVTGSSTTVTVSAEGITTIEYYATDASGNAEPPRTLTVRIDRTVPAVACSADPPRLWPPNRRLVPVQTVVTVEDALSGASGFTLLSVAGGGPEDVAGFAAGTPDTAGSLRAELDLARRTRLYTLVYEGADRAGNTSRCTVEVAVAVGG